MDIEKYLSSINRLFNNYKEVLLSYLYGSYATGNDRAWSDIDIGIVLEGNIPEGKYFNYQIELMGKLSSVFEKDEVIVVILNEATVLLCYEVIRYGKILYVRDEKQRIEFECKIMREYFDTERMRRINNYYLHKSIKEDYYGYRIRRYRASTG